MQVSMTSLQHSLGGIRQQVNLMQPTKAPTHYGSVFCRNVAFAYSFSFILIEIEVRLLSCCGPASKLHPSSLLITAWLSS